MPKASLHRKIVLLISVIAVATAVVLTVLPSLLTRGGVPGIGAVWTKEIGSVGDNCIAPSLVIDRRGFLYLAGTTEVNLFGKLYGDHDAYLAKYDIRGHAVWEKQFGVNKANPADDDAYDVNGINCLTIIVDNYIMVSGYGLAGQPEPGVDQLATFSPGGKLLRSTIPSSEVEVCSTAVATDLSGNVYLAGYWTGDECNHPYVIKVNPTERVNWNRHIMLSEGYNAYATDIAVDAVGSVFVVGSAEGPSWGGRTGFIVKISPDGRQVWEHKFEGSAEALAVCVARDGSIYVAGGTETGNPAPRLKETRLNQVLSYADRKKAERDLKVSGSKDGYLDRYDTNGKRIWRRQVITRETDKIVDLTLDEHGNIYCVGYGGNANGSELPIKAVSCITKCDSDGNILWTKPFRIGDTTLASSIVLDSSRNIYVAGITRAAGSTSGRVFITKFKQQTH